MLIRMWNWMSRKPAYEYGVLMVCAGNICRSPTAEGVLRQRLVELDLHRRILVDSAGTYPQTGQPPDPRTQAAARKRGYDLAKLRARPVQAADFERFDLILAMDDHNLERLRELCPVEHHAKLALLLAHAAPRAELREVPDPYYGPPEGFERVLDLIEAACAPLAQALLRQGGTGP